MSANTAASRAAEAARKMAAEAATAATQKQQPQPSSSLDERAQKSGVDKNAKDPYEDDGNAERVFTLKLKPYIEPKDIDSLDETRRVDEENARRYDFNVTQLPILTILFRRVGQNSFKLPKPPIYNERARTLYLQKCNEPSFKTVEAIRFLTKRGKVFGRDFTLEDASQKADDEVINDFLAEKKRAVNARINVRDAVGVPSDHHNHCTCNYTWDGISPNCLGPPNSAKRLRLTWRVPPSFNFLMPTFEVFSH